MPDMVENVDAIRAAAAAYIESWLAGDEARMRGCLNPELAKRRVADPASGELSLHEVPAAALVADAAMPKEGIAPGYSIDILDVTAGSASVKVLSAPFVDYLHLARFGQRWLIVNVLYERKS